MCWGHKARNCLTTQPTPFLRTNDDDDEEDPVYSVFSFVDIPTKLRPVHSLLTPSYFVLFAPSSLHPHSIILHSVLSLLTLSPLHHISFCSFPPNSIPTPSFFVLSVPSATSCPTPFLSSTPHAKLRPVHLLVLTSQIYKSHPLAFPSEKQRVIFFFKSSYALRTSS